jgi:hypothetical protein
MNMKTTAARDITYLSPPVEVSMANRWLEIAALIISGLSADLM